MAGSPTAGYGEVAGGPLTPQVARSISEGALLETIVGLAEAYGWKAHHVLDQRHYAKRIGTGFPDLVMVNEGQRRLLVAELKSQRGSVSDAQWEWLWSFYSLGFVEVYLWHPSDLDEAQRTLQEGWKDSSNCELALLAWRESAKERHG